ncbi:calcium/sodium antiporter [Breoghania sp. L-A4]|uniref:calcium/sodium antiporter n=1 Tax=Breoghania sp. L-A4 TaxID=2304600 RepID=UPI000E35FB24|nr:calcium/sodium antiporter [Breoghania sp. L-A4]AXS41173.1 sodium:calcium antiporter [Breoghania sp. L-A4]
MLFVELFAGLLLLVLGGDLLVRGSVGLAERLNVSPLLIGLVLVGFGTSTPELLTSVLAALDGSPGIAIGNVVGSNIANILLILGTAAIIHPLRANPEALRRDGSVVALAAMVALGLALAGTIDRLSGMAMLLGLAGYIGYTYRAERGKSTPSAEMHRAEAHAVVAQPHPSKAWLLGLMAAGGLAITMLGAHWLVSASIELATRFGVSDTIIGLTIVAVGTSLPELVTSVVAALRKQADIAFGNILGSNIYNVLGILGVTAVIQPIDVPQQIVQLDIWVMIGATALLLVFARSGHRICRLEGFALLGLYGAYMAVLALA